MSARNHDKFVPQNYLFIPSVPTPNGRLHLGHIGGPYLSADILARYVRLCGHSARIITGTDDFESYVTAQAAKEQKTPELICRYYHPLIADDLAAMDIQIDHFVHPVSERWPYQQWHERIFEDLITKGHTQTLKEQVLWDEYHNRFQVGCWLRGLCPLCQEKTASYFCEACGACYRPEEVIQETKGILKEVENIFLRLPKAPHLHHTGINPKIENLYSNFLKQQNHLFRLTANAKWGLRYNGSYSLFSYGFVFAYFLMFGELYGKLTGTHQNAFAQDSSVITIACFGQDNALPFLSSILGITAACEQYKPFDYYLINYFYTLDGAKFSTSRRHAIWVHEILNKQRLSSDIIRLYLSSIDVRNDTGNFDSAEFNHFYNQTLEWQNRFILDALPNVPEVDAPCPPHIKEHLNNLLAVQEKTLQPHHFFPHEAINTLQAWLKLGHELKQQTTSYFWWLQAFSLFLYPFMPKFGKALWQSLGYQQLPTMNDLYSFPLVPRQNNVNLRSMNDKEPKRFVRTEEAL